VTRPSSRALLLASAAAVLAGCAWTSPSTTQLPYEPSDGTGGAIGDLLLRNVLVVAAEEGGTGALVGVLVNRGPDELSVELTTLPEDGGDSFSETVEVPANSSLRLEEEEVLLESVDVPLGALLPLEARTDEGGVELQLPVLDPSGPYDGLLPTSESTAEDPVTPSPSGEPSTNAPAETEGGDG
jgi:hypothetical protein